jgi:hypothetical protein
MWRVPKSSKMQKMATMVEFGELYLRIDRSILCVGNHATLCIYHIVSSFTSLLAPGCLMETFPSNAPLRYWNKISATLKFYMCNFEKYVTKQIYCLTRIENCRNINTMFHTTFTVKHTGTIVEAWSIKINHWNICWLVWFFFLI